MGQVRVYINPFNTSGEYTEYEEVTKYVLDKSFKVKRKVDNDDFNVGVFKYSNVSMTFSNIDGLFSDVDNIRSMFAYKRAGSKVKITWDVCTDDVLCGVVYADGAFLGEEVTIFEGLLNDDGTKTEIRQQNIGFKVLGFESIFSEVETPYSLLTNGDDASDIIYDCLNQSAITDLLTVSAGNITLSVNPSVDDVSDLENTTVKEALDILLEMSNSILYIKDDAIYVTSRTPGSAVQHTFQGQGSLTGIEDIQKLTAIRSGLNKTFNYWTWEDTTRSSQESSSVTQYGLRKKAISYDGITNNTTRDSILDDYSAEFGLPKQELKLTTPLSYDVYDIEILDRVAINYPNIYFSADENPLPLYGVAKFGEAIFPRGEWSLTIDPSTSYKVLGKDISLKKETITFYLREI